MFYEKVKESAQFIQGRTSLRPTTGIILGSGLGSLVDIMEERTVIPYTEIPNFPRSHVAGHAGNLVIGRIGQEIIAAMQGRFHYYEGFTMKEVTYPIYVMKLLGVKNLIVTNACGGINRDFEPGDLMILTDYINMLGNNSLIGENDERFGVRFPDMSEAYAKELIRKAEKTAEKLGISCKKGVYAIFSGPCYETAAEIRAYERLGADAIGMSTVPEAITARHAGMDILGFTLLSNMAAGILDQPLSGEEVNATAEASKEKFSKLVLACLEKM